jgi:hypothetical protein
MKKVMILLGSLTLLLSLGVGTSLAADIWLNNYTVSQVNVVGSEVSIKVTNGTNALNRNVTATEANKFLAMALTAISSSLNVDICVDSVTQRYTKMNLRP